MIGEIPKHSRYAGIEYDDVANGDGLGAVFFTQHCPWHCEGCQNPQTWDKNGGMMFTEEVFYELLSYYGSVPFASRLTLSGGDPLSNNNLSITEFIIQNFKQIYPDKKIWLYTGFDYDDICMDANGIAIEPYQKRAKLRKYVTDLCDVIVDRPFILSKRDITLDYKGSSNQRVIDIPKTKLNNYRIVLFEK